MFRITRDPSSGSSVNCLAKITVMVPSWSNFKYFEYFIIIVMYLRIIYLFIFWIIKCFNVSLNSS